MTFNELLLQASTDALPPLGALEPLAVALRDLDVWSRRRFFVLVTSRFSPLLFDLVGDNELEKVKNATEETIESMRESASREAVFLLDGQGLEEIDGIGSNQEDKNNFCYWVSWFRDSLLLTINAWERIDDDDVSTQLLNALWNRAMEFVFSMDVEVGEKFEEAELQLWLSWIPEVNDRDSFSQINTMQEVPEISNLVNQLARRGP